MEGSAVLKGETSQSIPANGGWRAKGKNWFSAKAPSVSKGFKRFTERSPNIQEGFKKMSVKVEEIRRNAPMKEGLKRITTTTEPVKKGFMKITSKAPPLRDGLMKGTSSLGKGISSVSSFTQGETKLLMSKAKRKLYCRNEWSEDTELTASLDSVKAVKEVLESQRNGLVRMIKDQREFEESQQQFTLVLQRVPANAGGYSVKSITLGTLLQSQVKKLVPTNILQELVEKIDEILSKYSELQILKRKYTVAKIDVDVWSAKLESNEDSQKLQAEVVQGKQWCMQCKLQLSELVTKIMEMKSEVLDSILLQVSRDSSSINTSLSHSARW